MVAIARTRFIHSRDGVTSPGTHDDHIAFPVSVFIYFSLGIVVVECEFASMEESLMFKVAVVDFLIKRLVFEMTAVHPLDPRFFFLPFFFSFPSFLFFLFLSIFRFPSFFSFFLIINNN